MTDVRVTKVIPIAEINPSSAAPLVTKFITVAEIDVDSTGVLASQVGVLAELFAVDTAVRTSQVGVLAEVFEVPIYSYIFSLYANATNYIDAFWSSPTEITLEFNDGSGVHSGTWDATGAIIQDITYQFVVAYTNTTMILSVDGDSKIVINTPINFAVVPTTAYWAQNSDNERVATAVYTVPLP